MPSNLSEQAGPSVGAMDLVICCQQNLAVMRRQVARTHLGGEWSEVNVKPPHSSEWALAGERGRERYQKSIFV